MPIRISPAALSDLDDLVRLNCVVQVVHARMHPRIFRADWDAADVKDFWRQRLREAENAVTIATDDAVAVGYIWFEIQERPANHFTFARRRLHIHHIAVDAARRRQGAGSALFDYAEAQAKQLGIGEVTVETWHANAPAQAFFAARGYGPLKLMLAKSGGA